MDNPGSHTCRCDDKNPEYPATEILVLMHAQKLNAYEVYEVAFGGAACQDTEQGDGASRSERHAHRVALPICYPSRLISSHII
jgi:hypothetical protein